MTKPLMLLSAAILIAAGFASVSRSASQEAAPAQAAAPAAQAPAHAAPVKGPVPLDAKNPVTPTPASLAEAKGIYNRDCALCHGANGDGKTDLATSMNMGDMTDPKTLAGRQDGELFDIIRVGSDKMPGEDAGRAKDVVVWNMIHYLRGFSKAQPAAPTTAATTPSTGSK